MKKSDLKTMLISIADDVCSMGYAKNKNSFWKIQKDFFYLIDFQPGAHGNYFFINVGLHPVGFPKILSDRLVILERPLEHECIIRQRIEQICRSTCLDSFLKCLVPPSDKSIVENIKKTIVEEVEPWMQNWGKFDAIAKANRSELGNFINAVPIIRDRATLMLQCYCLLKIERFDQARFLFDEIKSLPCGNWQFGQVDSYLASFLKY